MPEQKVALILAVAGLQDGKNITTIQTTDFIPVDLKFVYLYNLELAIAKAKLMQGDEDILQIISGKKQRNEKIAIDKYCWNKTLKYYADYNFKITKQSNDCNTCRDVSILFFSAQTPDYLSLLGKTGFRSIKIKLLQPGGIVTTTANNTGEQWDAPNGWAPLQWMTIWGLDRCGQRELARDISTTLD